VIQVDLTNDVAEIEVDDYPLPLVTLSTGSATSLRDIRSCRIFIDQLGEWVEVSPVAGASSTWTRSQSGQDRFYVAQRELVTSGYYEVLSMNRAGNERVFLLDLAVEPDAEDGVLFTFTVKRGSSPSLWLTSEGSFRSTDASDLCFKYRLPVTKAGFGAISEVGAVSENVRPTVWDRLGEDET
jgi:hypothetical protein